MRVTLGTRVSKVEMRLECFLSAYDAKAAIRTAKMADSLARYFFAQLREPVFDFFPHLFSVILDRASRLWRVFFD